MANPMAKNRQSFRFSNLDHKREDLEVQSQSQTEPHISSRGVFFFWRGGGVEPAWVHFRLNPFPQDKLLLGYSKMTLLSCKAMDFGKDLKKSSQNKELFVLPKINSSPKIGLFSQEETSRLPIIHS